jgi:hypothetical protein
MAKTTQHPLDEWHSFRDGRCPDHVVYQALKGLFRIEDCSDESQG